MITLFISEYKVGCADTAMVRRMFKKKVFYYLLFSHSFFFFCVLYSFLLLIRFSNVLKWPILLTYPRMQSPWEANWFAASKEIPRISRNPKVHYRTNKRPPPVSILDQPNPVHIPTSHLLEIHPNIIHPSTPRSPQWSLYLRFPHQDPIHTTLLTHTRHMPSPSPIHLHF